MAREIESIRCERLPIDDRGAMLGFLAFNRPAEMNPLDQAAVGQMRAAIEDFCCHAAVRVLAVTGRGKAFSAGGDMKKYMNLHTPVGQPGEIWVRGDAASLGYWRQPEATAASYAGGWFRSGDLAKRDADGSISILDRKNDMIISGGFNVYRHEIEGAIAEHGTDSQDRGG